MSILPMAMTGSMASTVGVLKRSQALSWLPGISLMNTFSFELIAIFLAYLLPAKVMKRKEDQKLKISVTLASTTLFFTIVIPTLDGDARTIVPVQDKIGANGMLVSVAVGIFIAQVFGIASKYSLSKKDSVMPDIAVDWVDALIPVTVCLAVGLGIYATGFDLYPFIRGLFAPVTTTGQTLPGMISVSFLTYFLYFFGFTRTLFPIVWAIWMEGMATNIAAVAAGQVATNVTLMEISHGLIYIDGQGATLTLVILAIFSRSKWSRAIGWVTIFPSIFNINRPAVFGAPVVQNPILMIPSWLNSIIPPIITYVAFRVGFVPVPTQASQMWYLPVHIQTYFGTGSIMGMVLCLILIAVSFLVWLPFFKAYEKQEYEEEMKTGYVTAGK